MQDLEPFYNWRHLYVASEDELSPFYEREYSEFEYSSRIYNFFIHPQWDDMGSETLYIKILFVDYELSFAIIEMIGEWNDVIGNDIMFLKRDIIDVLISEGINNYILIGENVLNFHASEDDYYEEWFSDIEDGWIVGLNFRDHVITEFEQNNIDQYILFSERFDAFNWRKYQPIQLFEVINLFMSKRLNP